MTASAESKPTAAKNSSRRALLAGVLGGIGAVAATAVGRVNPVRAEGENIVVGGELSTAESRTFLRNVTNDEHVFWAESTGSGIGVIGGSGNNIGVSGFSGTYDGVSGISNTPNRAAVRGYANNDGTGLLGGSGATPLAKPKTGVYGYANQDGNSKGVWGFSGMGVGVYGKANKDGIALRANGRIKADKVSGVKTIPAGSTTATVSPGVNVSSGSFVLLTPKTNIGSRALWFTTQPAADTFKIRMSSSRSSNTRVAWLLLG